MDAASIDLELLAQSVDQRVFLYNISWSDFETLLVMRGDAARPRMAYLEGTLELMTTSQDHGILKKRIARLVEAYAEELGIELEGYGSWTLKKQKEERGVEADQCDTIGPAAKEQMPDLAMEVIWTHGGLDRLEIYRRLGVRELWIWRKNTIGIWALRGERYQPIPRSEILPDIDIDLVVSLLDTPTQTAAVRELRARLEASTGAQRTDFYCAEIAARPPRKTYF
jgi:Uma2 family endonuclease